MKSLITVTPEILESLEKIMHSGTRGTHLLFSNRMIREAFAQTIHPEKLSEGDLAGRVREALSDLVELEDLEDRQEYIRSLDRDLRDLLVHLYFGFLDRFLEQPDSPEVLH